MKKAIPRTAWFQRESSSGSMNSLLLSMSSYFLNVGDKFEFLKLNSYELEYVLLSDYIVKLKGDSCDVVSS